MNYLTGKKILVVYRDSELDPYGVAAAYDVLNSNPTATLYNVDGIATATITSHISGLSVGTYDDVIFTCAISSVGSASVPNYDAVSAAWGLLKTAHKGTVVTTGTVLTNGGNSGSVADIGVSITGYNVANYFNGLYLTFTAGTHINTTVKILSYAVTNTLVTMGGTASGSAYDNTDVFSMYYTPHLLVATDPAYNSATNYYATIGAIATCAKVHIDGTNTLATSTMIVWDYLHTTNGYNAYGSPNNAYPPIIADLGRYGQTYFHGLTTSSATPSLTTFMSTAAVAAWAGKYVWFPTLGYYAKISTVSAGVSCTVTNIKYDIQYPFALQLDPYNNMVLANASTGVTAFPVTVGTSTAFYIVNSPADVFKYAYAQLYVRTNLIGLTNNDVLLTWKKLIDNGNKLSSHSTGMPEYDTAKMQEVYIMGKQIYQGAVLNGITSVL